MSAQELLGTQRCLASDLIFLTKAKYMRGGGLISFSYSNGSNATIIRQLCKSKFLLYCISAGLKSPLQVTLDHFRPATLCFDKFLLHKVARWK